MYLLYRNSNNSNHNLILIANDLSQNITDSRRNSSETIPKCDNVTKYPDKKQIEDKLNQIREYLHITSTLMSNMKNSDQVSVAYFRYIFRLHFYILYPYL